MVDDHLSHLLVENSGDRNGKLSIELSVLLHVSFVALVLFAGRVAVDVYQAPHPTVKTRMVDIGDYLPPADQSPHGGGGGGDRSQLPAARGRAPQFDLIQIVPPTEINRNDNPRLTAEQTILGPPELVLPQSNLPNIGMPASDVVGPPSNGPGSGAGIGTGCCSGIGPGNGAGLGPGDKAGWGGDVYRPGVGGVTAPVLLSSVEPEYSDEARKAKQQGTVVLYIIVDADGSVRSVRVVNSLGLGLDERAVAAVRQWRFKPGTSNGRAVPVIASVEVSFRLL